MTFEQLHAFIIVAETLSMTRAAERLHLTQPAVSAAIAALEERQATRLFDRVGRHLELTAAGKVFLPEARAVIARLEEARRVFDDLAGLARGELRLAASQTVATYWLPRADGPVRRRQSRHPSRSCGRQHHAGCGAGAEAARRILPSSRARSTSRCWPARSSPATGSASTSPPAIRSPSGA